MNFLARVITKRSIKEVLKVIETYFLGPTNDLIFGSISPLVLGGVGIPRLIRVMAYLPESLFRGSRQGLSLLSTKQVGNVQPKNIPSSVAKKYMQG